MKTYKLSAFQAESLTGVHSVEVQLEDDEQILSVDAFPGPETTFHVVVLTPVNPPSPPRKRAKATPESRASRASTRAPSEQHEEHSSS